MEKNKYSENECIQWFGDKSRNPRTGRSISIDGPTYKRLEKQCKYVFTHEDCINWRKNPRKNPRTGKKIRDNSKTYRILNEKCSEYRDELPIDLIMTIIDYLNPRDIIELCKGTGVCEEGLWIDLLERDYPGIIYEDPRGDYEKFIKYPREVFWAIINTLRDEIDNSDLPTDFSNVGLQKIFYETIKPFIHRWKGYMDYIVTVLEQYNEITKELTKYGRKAIKCTPKWALYEYIIYQGKEFTQEFLERGQESEII